MYCPQCGTESSSGLQYCRGCGANLKIIGKAVALSEAVARSDRGPLPKIKEMVKGLKVEHATEEVSKALERMNNEIAEISPESRPREYRPLISLGRKKTPAERRESHISKGIVSLFSGVGMTVFLYYLSAAIVLKLPPDVITQIPVELEPVVRVIWLLGLIPALTGLGHIIAGLLIQTNPQQRQLAEFPQQSTPTSPTSASIPRSVTEHTTNLLDRESLPD
jgi:hypothetical protein